MGALGLPTGDSPFADELDERGSACSGVTENGSGTHFFSHNGEEMWVGRFGSASNLTLVSLSPLERSEQCRGRQAVTIECLLRLIEWVRERVVEEEKEEEKREEEEGRRKRERKVRRAG